VLIEYATLDEAKAAIEGAHDTKLLDQTITVDYAFVRPPPERAQGGARGGRGGARGGGRTSGGRARSRSPGDDRRRDRDGDDDAE
jgi:RNA-binding protein 8A